MAEDLKAIGRFRWHRPHSPYEKFIEGEGVPIVRGLGVYDVRQVVLGPWPRTGGRGAYLELDGLQNRNGLYVIEIPAGGALKPEKHMYEEMYYVVDGRGSTEVWRDGLSAQKQIFEWQTGSLFSPPLNSWHRLVNASSSPVRLVVGTNAPPIMAMFRSEKFIFDNPFQFDDRYPERDDYFKPTELSIRPENGRHINLGNLIPDAISCELPLENHRGAGHRNFAWRLSGNTYIGFVAQYPPGRYSKAHYHPGGPVLICLRGKGYLVTWPKDAGIRPWENGKGHLVERQDYGECGVVSAAPGNGDWYHAHFGVSKEPFRVMAFLGGYPRNLVGAPGDEVSYNLDQRRGGNSIEYRDEDPQIRRDYIAALKKEGAEFQMPDSLYDPANEEFVAR
jgi:quercetin dioxygenase-like cupin family protein